MLLVYSLYLFKTLFQEAVKYYLCPLNHWRTQGAKTPIMIERQIILRPGVPPLQKWQSWESSMLMKDVQYVIWDLCSSRVCKFILYTSKGWRFYSFPRITYVFLCILVDSSCLWHCVRWGVESALSVFSIICLTLLMFWETDLPRKMTASVGKRLPRIVGPCTREAAFFPTSNGLFL